MALALTTVACNQSDRQNGNNTDGNVEITVDSIVDKTATHDGKLQIDVVKSGNKQLDDAVMEYVFEEFAGDFLGDFIDTKGMLRQAADSVVATLKEAETDMDLSSGIILEDKAIGKVLYQTNSFLTYEIDRYEYMGGPHGTGTKTGQTFRKRDGRRLTWNDIKSWGMPELNEMVVDGLKKYLDISTNGELQEALFVSINPLPCPSTQPLFGPDGIIVRYQPYEIGPYAMGMPECVIPYEKLKTMMTKRLYKEIVEGAKK